MYINLLQNYIHIGHTLLDLIIEIQSLKYCRNHPNCDRNEYLKFGINRTILTFLNFKKANPSRRDEYTDHYYRKAGLQKICSENL